MRLEGRRQSTNVEDRRGQAMRRGMPIGCGGLILILVIAAITGADPSQLADLVGGAGGQPQPGPSTHDVRPANDELGVFASRVLAHTEDTWNRMLPQLGHQYREPRLVLFGNAVQSACGYNSAAVGPFYCPADQKVYVDLAFFDTLERRFGAPGDFAQAYVLAHEVGHHVQNQLGIAPRVHEMQRRVGRAEANELSVRLELQADCLAGVWGNAAARDGILERGDIEEGLRAAAAIGDDMIQKRSQGYTVPESWTHGSAEQRVGWLRRGLESGDPSSCETFDTGRRR